MKKKIEEQKVLPRAKTNEWLMSLKYFVDEEEGSHLSILDHDVCLGCEKKPCLTFCPADVYVLDEANVVQVAYNNCVECGSCRIGCPYKNIRWVLPRGSFGVAYKFG